MDSLQTKKGDIFELGEHRLICGDATNPEVYDKLMAGNLARVAFCDPPYGLKKQNVDYSNDNLNFRQLLEFNQKWIANIMPLVTPNGSFYIWGIDEPLMDIYSNILKPLIFEKKISFRNLITWIKKSGNGINNPRIRCFARLSEKCLFFVKGVQGFNNNANHFFEGFEPIREYLLKSREIMNWDVKTLKRIVKHSDASRDHWTSKSQWAFISEKNYILLQKEAEYQRKVLGLKNEAFKKSYEKLKEEHSQIVKDFNDYKNTQYNSRAYFNNTHEAMTCNWDFSPHKKAGTEGNHPTIKPIPLVVRCIKTSSPEKKDIILDPFAGSGTTFLACEETERICYGIEFSEKYCDTIISRWELSTNKKAKKII